MMFYTDARKSFWSNSKACTPEF